MTPFDEGVAAAQLRTSKDDNPYPQGTPSHSDWDAGYDSAVEAHDATETNDDK